MKTHAYASLTRAQLDRHLNERIMQGKLTRKESAAIYLAHEEAVAAHRKEGGRRGAARRYWTPLLKPLRYEMRNASHCLSRFAKLPDREAEVHAYTAYLDVLRGLNNRIKTAINSSLPPGQLREIINRPIPNEGRSWQDWVSPKEQARVRALFNAIPPRHKAKRKEPFTTHRQAGETVSPN